MERACGASRCAAPLAMCRRPSAAAAACPAAAQGARRRRSLRAASLSVRAGTEQETEGSPLDFPEVRRRLRSVRVCDAAPRGVRR